MRLIAACLAALLFPATALAGKKGVAQKKSGLRLKVTQSLFDLQDDWALVGEDEGNRTRTQTLGLLNAEGGRTEITYLLGSGFEVGAIAGLQQQSTSVDGAGIETSLAWDLALTGAYNLRVSEGARVFVQPLVGLTRLTAQQGDAGPVRGTQGLWFGVASGVRVRLFKRVTVDPQLEYTRRHFTYAVDGEAAEDLAGRQQNFGLRLGLTVLL